MLHDSAIITAYASALGGGAVNLPNFKQLQAQPQQATGVVDQALMLYIVLLCIVTDIIKRVFMVTKGYPCLPQRTSALCAFNQQVQIYCFSLNLYNHRKPVF